MDDAVSFTERLMHLFARYVTGQAQMPVGQALVRAKRQYLGEVPSGGFGTYDEKVLVISTLYGLPMYRVTVPNPGPWGQASTTAQAHTLPQAESQTNRIYAITKTLSILYDPLVSTSDGSYYTVDTLAHASPGRPIQPKTTIPLDVVPNMKPHGALLLGATSETEPSFNPLIAQPVPTSTTSLAEPDFETQAWFPTKPFAINRLAGEIRLVVVPAQFMGNQDDGVLRRFTEVTFTVVYSDSSDHTPPVIWGVKGTIIGETASVKVSAGDASGIERVLITYSATGQHWHSADLTYQESTGFWEGSMTGMTEEVTYFVQVMDGAGNVTLSANKGQYFAPEEHALFLPVIMRESQ
jgi:hypothetical protein